MLGLSQGKCHVLLLEVSPEKILVGDVRNTHKGKTDEQLIAVCLLFQGHLIQYLHNLLQCFLW